MTSPIRNKINKSFSILFSVSLNIDFKKQNEAPGKWDDSMKLPTSEFANKNLRSVMKTLQILNYLNDTRHKQVSSWIVVILFSKQNEIVFL